MEARKSIGVAITHRNREEAFFKTYSNIVKYLPKEAVLVVVDDASDMPCKLTDYRFDTRVGISMAKNKCISLLYDKGCEYFFLFDSDVYPIVGNWHVPYIESGQDHLCYTFLPYLGISGNIKIHALGNGCLLFLTRKAIDTVGGFDTEFGLGKFEHTELSHRIHNAGLTPYVFMDVVGSDKLFHSMDEHGEVYRTLSPGEQKALMSKNSILFNLKRKDKHFKPYVQ